MKHSMERPKEEPIDELPQQKSPSKTGRILKGIGTGALLTMAALSPEAGRAEDSAASQEKDPGIHERNQSPEHARMQKYTGWLADMAEERPVLKRATLHMLGKFGFRISLRDGRELAVMAEEALTLQPFIKAVERALEKKVEVSRRETPTEAVAQGWLAKLAENEPELRGARLHCDGKRSGFLGGGSYRISFGKNEFYWIDLSAEENTQGIFAERVRAALRRK